MMALRVCVRRMVLLDLIGVVSLLLVLDIEVVWGDFMKCVKVFLGFSQKKMKIVMMECSLIEVIFRLLLKQLLLEIVAI